MGLDPLVVADELRAGFFVGGGPMNEEANCDVASGRNCPNSESKSSWFSKRLETLRE